MSDPIPSQDLAGAQFPSPMMTVRELAERLAIDASTAYRYLRSGKLPGVQVGNGWLIDRARVERFLAGVEDAAGNPLVHAPPPPAALTLLPERTPDTTDVAMSWLRGAQAAMDLLVGAAERSTSERSEHRVGA